MKKKLSALALEAIKPAADRYEVSDAAMPALRVIVHPSGAKTWAMRFRRPGMRNKMAKMTLGSFHSGGATGGVPVLGGPLTLAEARSLATTRSGRPGNDLGAGGRSPEFSA